MAVADLQICRFEPPHGFFVIFHCLSLKAYQHAGLLHIIADAIPSL